MIKNDFWIKQNAGQGMIQPFIPELVREHLNYDNFDSSSENAVEQIIKKPGKKVISYGLSSYGYDIRLSNKDFRIFKHIPGTIIDPKRFSANNLEVVTSHTDETGEYFILPGRSYGLGVALEKLEIPDNITVICIGKSTYARCGIIANLTPGEAGWRGHLTLEFSNSSPADAKIYCNEGVVQLLFFEGEFCETTYETRNGKYQDQQQRVTIAKV